MCECVCDYTIYQRKDQTWNLSKQRETLQTCFIRDSDLHEGRRKHSEICSQRLSGETWRPESFRKSSPSPPPSGRAQVRVSSPLSGLQMHFWAAPQRGKSYLSNRLLVLASAAEPPPHTHTEPEPERQPVLNKELYSDLNRFTNHKKKKEIQRKEQIRDSQSIHMCISR